MAGLAEGRPRNVKPAVAGQQLVGIGTVAEKIDQMLKLLRVLGADVGSLTRQMLRVSHTTDLTVVGLVTVARVDDDGADTPSGRFQQVQATILQVKHDLRRRKVVGMLLQVEELAQHKVRRKLDVIDCCVHNNAF